jgi:hypothetical protein
MGRWIIALVTLFLVLAFIWTVNLLQTAPPTDGAGIQPAIYVDPNVTLTFETPSVRTLSNG